MITIIDNKIKVIICNDIEQIQLFLTSAINNNDDMEVVGVASSGNEAVKIARNVKADIILMDIQMESEKDGIIATEKITKFVPDVKVVMLTIHDSDDLIIDSYYAGAVDYIVKTSDKELICQRIREIYSKNLFLGPLIVKNINKEMKIAKQLRENLLFYLNCFSTLTKTEKEIINLLYNGYSRDQIANMRHIEISTIKSHIRHILIKFQVNSTKELMSLLKTTKFLDNLEV